MRARVYFNLRKQCLSVMDKSTRRVISHTDSITLTNVKFVVSKKGVERIRRNKRKAVVAFVEGDIEAWHVNPDCSICKTRRSAGLVKFNPYKWNTFVLGHTQAKIDSCDYATVNGKVINAYFSNQE